VHSRLNHRQKVQTLLVFFPPRVAGWVTHYWVLALPHTSVTAHSSGFCPFLTIQTEVGFATMPTWKRQSCQARAQVFSRAAFLGHRPGSNPQHIELCADIGQRPTGSLLRTLKPCKPIILKHLIYLKIFWNLFFWNFVLDFTHVHCAVRKQHQHQRCIFFLSRRSIFSLVVKAKPPPPCWWWLFFRVHMHHKILSS
jgi:hypothetical protein